MQFDLEDPNSPSHLRVFPLSLSSCTSLLDSLTLD